VAGGSAVLVAACGDDDSQKVATGTSPSGTPDVDILNAALDLEHTAVAAYTAGLPRLRGDVARLGRQFLGQEREHVGGLTQAIKDLGGAPNAARRTYDFPTLRNQTDVLNFAVDLENGAVATYIDALPKLSSPALRGTAAAILTNEAEHIAVLLGALGKPPVPDAFVVGKR
jgi:rubrerythrin